MLFAKSQINSGSMFLLGGLGWSFYSYFDWLIMGRIINTGYPSRELFDFISFGIPLILGYGLAIMYRFNVTVKSPFLKLGMWLSYVGLAFISSAMFFAEWINLGKIPFFVLLFFPGSLILSLGLLLILRISNNSLTRLIIVVISLCTIAYPIIPQFVFSAQGSLVATNTKGILGIILGVCWSIFGLLLLVRRNSSTR